MIMLMLMLATQQTAEVTPSLSAMSIATGSNGVCSGGAVLQPSSIVVNWTAANFNSATQDFKLYRDGVLVSTLDTTAYNLVISGLVERDQHHPQDITFNYRVDIVRTSDSVVLASRSASVTKSYGNCAGGL